ncbi:MAG: dihydrolipoamide acetyltransferase family protein [Acidimicrobiales bacterium]
MPKLSLGDDTEMRVVRWVASVGDTVTEGQPLLEVETDKTTLEVEAPASGVLLRVLATAEEIVTHGSIIGLVGDPDEIDDAGTPAESNSRPAGAHATLASGAGDLESAAGRSAEAVAATEPESAPPERVAVRHGALGGLPSRRLSRRRDLVGRRDIRASSPAADLSVVGGAYEVVEATAHRRAVARAMERSSRVPQFPVFRDFDVTGLRRQLESRRETVPEATLTDVILTVVAHSLRRHPSFNSWYDEGRWTRFADINIALAVDGPHGVVAPTIRRVDTLDPGELTARRADLVSRSQSGELKPDDLVGATFTVSNIGPLGANALAPLLTPPQVAVLGVGRLRPVGTSALMTMTLVSDHRCLDGADAARFLSSVAEQCADIPR